jgi:DNA invertase Pin-like site-specific DNA recombinase
VAAKRKVLSIVRVSSIEQADPEKDGIPRQLRHIAEHCKKFNLQVVTEYRLEGISGAKVQFNPRFKDMIRRLAEPSISGVVFSRMDRFFRPEHLDAYEIFKTFRREKKLLFCDLAATDGLDVTNPQDQMKIQLWGMVAAQERRNIAERNREGKEASRKKADRKSDPLPVGVNWDETTGLFSYDPDYRRKVKEAFRLVLAGSSLSSIVRKLGFSSQTALRKILKNQWWIGNKTHLQRRVYQHENDTIGRKVPLENPVIVPTNLTCAPAVNPVQFEEVQQILERKVKTWTQRKTVGDDFLGPGLLHCGCGRKMYLKKGTSRGIGLGTKPDYYVCASKWNGEQGTTCKNLPAAGVDFNIAWTATNLFIKEDFIRQSIERNFSDDNRSDLESEVERLTKLIASLETKRERAMVKSLSDDSYDVLVKKLKEEIATARAILLKLKVELGSKLTKPDIKKMAFELRQKYWDFGENHDGNWNRGEQKKLLNETLEKIIVRDEGRVLEFIMKGGVLLQPMSQQELGRLHLEEAPLGRFSTGIIDDPEGPSGKTMRQKSRVSKGNGVSKLKTRAAAAITGTRPMNAAARAPRSSNTWARSAGRCWTASTCTSKCRPCRSRNCGRARAGRVPARCGSARWPRGPGSRPGAS